MKRTVGHPGSVAILLALLLACAPSLWADRTKLKPGMNAYSPQQDIQLGRQAAQEVERKTQLCNDPEVDAYLTKLGQRLIEHLNTGGIQYRWEFHCVNDKAINAFALPGGFVFVNRGAIEAADNEAQLAGVMAHELSHVALRHGTNQATKAQYAQLGTGILGVAGGIVGGTIGAAAAGAGQFAFGSVLLKYSRGAETQADVMGTQVLYDSGYDPRALAAFFENLNASSAGKVPPQFFSDHPNPDHRIERVEEEIRKMGGVPEGAQKDSPEFEAIKREVLALPAPVKGRPEGSSSAQPTSGVAKAAPGELKVEDPSLDVTATRLGKASLAFPTNWKYYSRKNSLVLLPAGGAVDTGNGQNAIACGVIGGIAKIKDKNSSGDVLTENTNRLLEALQKENEGMEIQKAPSEITVDGRRALSALLRGESPIGGPEKDWVLTVVAPEGLYYLVFVVPESSHARFDKAFESIVESIQFQK